MLKCSRKNSSVYIALVTPNSYSKILPCISLCFRKGYWLTLRWSWCSSLSSTLPLLITFPESLADWLLGSFSQQEALEIRKRRARISCLLHSLLWEVWLYPVPWDSPSLCGFSSTHPSQPHLWFVPHFSLPDHSVFWVDPVVCNLCPSSPRGWLRLSVVLISGSFHSLLFIFLASPSPVKLNLCLIPNMVSGSWL